MSKKSQTIIVKGAEISIIQINEGDYISLTDMVRNFEDGLALIEKWLRNKKHNRISGYLGKDIYT